MKLNLGCGDKPLGGYTNIDAQEFTGCVDIVDDCVDLKKFDHAEGEIEEIYMNAVYEHLWEDIRKYALARWHKLLMPEGILRIDSIPDFDRIAKAVTNKEKSYVHSGVFGLRDAYGYIYGPDAKCEYLAHKDIFNAAKVEKELTEAGFIVKSITNVFWGNETIDVNLNVVAIKK